MNEFEYVKFKIEDSIAVLTLSRPEKVNIFNVHVWKEMIECQNVIRDSDDVRAVVICAEGRHFSAGIDLNFLTGMTPRQLRRLLQKSQPAYYGWESIDVPVIAAVQGKCMGNATELLLSCDLRIAAESAEFSFLEVKSVGISPDMGGTAKLARIVGIGQAKRLILTGEEIDAQEARRIGLVEYVCEDEVLLEQALKLAKNIARQPPIGIIAAKKGINLSAESSIYAASLYEQMQAMYCISTDDLKEAVSAALEKRRPTYKGE